MQQAAIEMPQQDIRREYEISASKMRGEGNCCYKYKRQTHSQEVVCLKEIFSNCFAYLFLYENLFWVMVRLVHKKSGFNHQ